MSRSRSPLYSVLPLLWHSNVKANYIQQQQPLNILTTGMIVTFDFVIRKMRRNTQFPHRLDLRQIWSESIKYTTSRGADAAKSSNHPYDMDLNLMTWKSCTTRNFFTCCIYTTYVANPSNGHRAIMWSRQKLSTTHVTLALERLTWEL